MQHPLWFDYRPKCMNKQCIITFNDENNRVLKKKPRITEKKWQQIYIQGKYGCLGNLFIYKKWHQIYFH